MRGCPRGGLVPLVLVLAGCAATRAAPASAPTAPPVAPPPAIVQVLRLAAPEGGRGRLELTKTVTDYRGSGSISVSDDVGQWTFSYAPVALPDPAPKPASLQALGIRFRSSSADRVEIDWDETSLLDPTGKPHRMMHRGDVTPESDVAVWGGGVGLEALPPVVTMTVVLTLRRGDERLAKKFVFDARPPEVEAPRPRAVSKWVGERFVVLPRPPSHRRAAYEALEVRDKIGRHPTHEEAAGAVLEVSGVKYDRLTQIVTFVREDTKQEYVARVVDGSVEGLAPLADIETARKEWQGKTLWLARPDLQFLGAGSADVGVLPVKQLALVEVVDVQLGWSSDAPIRFILRAPGGQLGFRDVHTTGTNVPETHRQRHAFAQAFLTDDPRSKFDWPAEIWSAVEDGRVVAGMTAAQARMSWGEPRRVERVVSGAGQEERWTYADRRALAIVDGIVMKIAQ